MALSNIFREPRREITETGVGVAVAVFVLIPDYFAALWFYQFSGGAKHGCPWFLRMILIPMVMFLAALLIASSVTAIHEIDEHVCNALARRGVELRPQWRAGR